MTLGPRCEQFLEEWLDRDPPQDDHVERTGFAKTAGRPSPEGNPNLGPPGDDPAPGATDAEHYWECPTCRRMIDRFAADRAHLRQHFGNLDVPSVPERLWADPLRSASGYPRRVSLNLMPFFLLLFLGGAILATALAIYAIKRQQSADSERDGDADRSRTEDVRPSDR